MKTFKQYCEYRQGDKSADWNDPTNIGFWNFALDVSTSEPSIAGDYGKLIGLTGREFLEKSPKELHRMYLRKHIGIGTPKAHTGAAFGGLV